MKGRPKRNYNVERDNNLENKHEHVDITRRIVDVPPIDVTYDI